MKPTFAKYIFVTVFVCWAIICSAQKGKTLLGVQMGNNLSIPGNSNAAGFNEKLLLRYSIGFLASTTIVDAANFKYLNILPVKQGVFTLDYGVNIIFHGYHYELKDFIVTNENRSIELPILLNFFDKKSVFSPKSWRRKGIASFARAGFKTSFSLGKDKNRELIDSGGTLRESLDYKNFNVLWSLSFGMLQNKKNGLRAGVETAANLGMFNLLEGKIEWLSSVNGNFSEASFIDRGTYLSINAFYLFDVFGFLNSELGKEPPILFNPRF